ncbi:hypothetical protein COCNU_15G004270 [Cocos nucifera]|uniref:Uncharacterized protein n=1 Tax=Cocos nucifera TaxID=13894 RepID=A0A8K0NDF4_COCNU|nr:hypothetical protein COCNU_15G004270 [Cocos nucifera]
MGELVDKLDGEGMGLMMRGGLVGEGDERKMMEGDDREGGGGVDNESGSGTGVVGMVNGDDSDGEIGIGRASLAPP